MAPAVRARRRGLGARGAFVFLIGVAALASWIYLGRQEQPAASAPDDTPSILRHVPPGAMLVAVVDVAALRHTPLGELLLGEGRTVAGLGEIKTICGADPMDVVDQMAVAIPDATQDAGFGLFAGGPIRAETLISCAEKIVSKRGGRPVRVSAGRFMVLKDASLELSSAELAAAEGGPVILAEPAYVRAALGTAASESVYSDERHTALRKLVPPGQLVATVVLSAQQRRSLIEELKAQNQAESPFRSVNGAALTATVDDQFQLAVAIRCDSAKACAQVAEHIRRAATSEAETDAARAIGLDTALSRMSVQALDDAVHVRLTMPAAEALTMLRRALALRRLAGAASPEQPPGDAPPPPTPSAPPARPLPDAGVQDAGERIEAKPQP